jgi:hypothetical protein
MMMEDADGYNSEYFDLVADHGGVYVYSHRDWIGILCFSGVIK